MSSSPKMILAASVGGPSTLRALSRSRQPGEDPAEVARDFMERAEGLLARLTAENGSLKEQLMASEKRLLEATTAHTAQLAAMVESISIQSAKIAELSSELGLAKERLAAQEATLASMAEVYNAHTHGSTCQLSGMEGGSWKPARLTGPSIPMKLG